MVLVWQKPCDCFAELFEKTLLCCWHPETPVLLDFYHPRHCRWCFVVDWTFLKVYLKIKCEKYIVFIFLTILWIIFEPSVCCWSWNQHLVKCWWCIMPLVSKTTLNWRTCLFVCNVYCVYKWWANCWFTNRNSSAKLIIDFR